MTPQDFHRIQSRRSFFRYCAGGLETIALSQMLQRDGYAADKTNPLAPRPPHFPGKAKNIIVPVHGRRAKPDGSVRSEAGAAEISRPVLAASQ